MLRCVECECHECAALWRCRTEELPEQVLAAARVTALDFSEVRPFPANNMEHLGEGGTEDEGDSWDSAKR